MSIRIIVLKIDLCLASIISIEWWEKNLDRNVIRAIMASE